MRKVPLDLLPSLPQQPLASFVLNASPIRVHCRLLGRLALPFCGVLVAVRRCRRRVGERESRMVCARLHLRSLPAPSAASSHPASPLPQQQNCPVNEGFRDWPALAPRERERGIRRAVCNASLAVCRSPRHGQGPENSGGFVDHATNPAVFHPPSKCSLLFTSLWQPRRVIEVMHGRLDSTTERRRLRRPRDKRAFTRSVPAARVGPRPDAERRRGC